MDDFTCALQSANDSRMIVSQRRAHLARGEIEYYARLDRNIDTLGALDDQGIEITATLNQMFVRDIPYPDIDRSRLRTQRSPPINVARRSASFRRSERQ